jgi:hypothetical protein
VTRHSSALDTGESPGQPVVNFAANFPGFSWNAMKSSPANYNIEVKRFDTQ